MLGKTNTHLRNGLVMLFFRKLPGAVLFPILLVGLGPTVTFGVLCECNVA